MSERDTRIVGSVGLGMGLAFGALAVFAVVPAVERLIDPHLPTWLGFPRDATDSETERSGVRLVTDHGTGCQYLETQLGGITPRLDKSGDQICD